MKKSLAIAFLVAMSIAFTASATPHQHYVKSVLGYTYSDGSTSCATIIGPFYPLDVIGQVIRECDGTWWNWGQIDCPDYEIEQEECGASAAQTQAPKPEDRTATSGHQQRLDCKDGK